MVKKKKLIYTLLQLFIFNLLQKKKKTIKQ